MFSSMLRQGYLPEARRALVSASLSTPPSTILKLSMRTPSSSICALSGGAEPGVLPPISAWWPREAT